MSNKTNNAKKLEAVSQVLISWRTGDLTEKSAILAIADIICPNPVTEQDIAWAERLRAQIEQGEQQ